MTGRDLYAISFHYDNYGHTQGHQNNCGFWLPDKQAEAIVSAMNDQGADIVTKEYLDMKLKVELKDQENRIVWKMLALFIAFAALIKWL